VLVLCAPGGWLGGLSGVTPMAWAVFRIGLGQLVISESNLHHNTADGAGGGLAADGVLAVAVGDCRLASNAAGGSGGGLALAGGAAVELLRTAVEENTAVGDGGGLAASDAALAVARDSTFSGNDATGFGGAIAAASARPVLFGGAVLLRTNSAGGDGGGICVFPPANTSCPAGADASLAGEGLLVALEGEAVATVRENTAEHGGGGIYLGCAGLPSPEAMALSAGSAGVGWVFERNTAGYGPVIASPPSVLVNYCSCNLLSFPRLSSAQNVDLLVVI
jgi:predicted outer membrane repeat protein